MNSRISPVFQLYLNKKSSVKSNLSGEMCYILLLVPSPSSMVLMILATFGFLFSVRTCCWMKKLVSKVTRIITDNSSITIVNACTSMLHHFRTNPHQLPLQVVQELLWRKISNKKKDIVYTWTQTGQNIGNNLWTQAYSLLRVNWLQKIQENGGGASRWCNYGKKYCIIGIIY